MQLSSTPGPGTYDSKPLKKPVYKSPVSNNKQYDL
jgi:hypothetical protein